MSPTRLVPRAALVLALTSTSLFACGDDDGVPEDGGPMMVDGGPSADGGGDLDGGVVEDAEVIPDGSYDAGPELAPLFRNPVTRPDLELAREALRIMGATAAGGTGGSCAECHGMTRGTIRYWRAISDVAYSACLSDLDVLTPEAGQAILDCLRGGTSDGNFEPVHIGVFASAARLDWFPFVFRRALGTDWEPTYMQWRDQAGMPPPDHGSLTQAQFDQIAEWFIRGAPMADAVLPDEPRPTDCTPSVSPIVAAHTAELATTGWHTVNEAAGLLMHGCAGASTPEDCLSTETLASSTAYGADWDVVPGSQARVLFTTTYRSSYWTRSSADGRFVGHGGGAGSMGTIIDLQRDFAIPVDAPYDPGFFPDNSGFLFLGGGAICEQSVLTTGMPTHITFREPNCRAPAMIGLYEHVGASLGGGDYWAVHGQWVGDPASLPVTNDPRTSFDASASMRLTRMTNTGTGFTPVETISVPTPYEGDSVISPSSTLVISRFGDTGDQQLGYVLRRVEKIHDPMTGAWTLYTPEVGRYCVEGGKPAFSYDERWLIYHHYIGATDADAIELGFTGRSDPGFAAYRTDGAANVYLLDLETGTATRITNMGPGQYALYPHFRSDGWIHFMVKTRGMAGEHVVASDAAFHL